MYSAAQLKTIHLELTSKCNAMCPMCLRTVFGGKLNPQLPITELSLSDIQKILPPEVLRGLKRIYLCGNYGDPAMAQDTLEILRYFRAQNALMRLEIFSNGGVRSAQWWSEVAAVVDRAHFAIDGLADTNHLYRRGVKWEFVLRNLRAFVAAGGQATWDFIVFKHNEHQVEEARALAQDLGVVHFQVKKTGRFFSNQKSAVKNRQEVCNSQGEAEYYLELPEKAEYRNPALLKEERLVQEHGSLRNYLEKGCISCKVVEEKSLYISAQGLAFPCCWVGNQLYPWYREAGKGEIWDLIRQLPEGLDSLSLLKQDLATVVDSAFFQQLLPQSWSRKSFAEGKLFVCAKTCGQVEFDAFRAQFSPSISPRP